MPSWNPIFEVDVAEKYVLGFDVSTHGQIYRKTGFFSSLLKSRRFTSLERFLRFDAHVPGRLLTGQKYNFNDFFYLTLLRGKELVGEFEIEIAPLMRYRYN